MRDAKKRQLDQLKPYGHHLGDGLVQVCFTLPISCDEKAQAVALAYAEQMGLEKCCVTWMEAIGEQYTYFIIYGAAQHSIELAQIAPPEGTLPPLARKIAELDQQFRKKLGRRVVMVACTDSGTEAAIDFEALLSLEGISGEAGLEGFTTFNLRRERQVTSVDAIVECVVQAKADVLLVCEPSQGWGRGEGGLRDLARKLRKCKDLPEWFVCACWRQDPAKADQPLADYDLSFGRGILPSRLADRLVECLSQAGLSAGATRHASGERRKKRRFLGLFGRGD